MDSFSTLQLLHEAVMSVLVTTIYGKWRGTITVTSKTFGFNNTFVIGTRKIKNLVFRSDAHMKIMSIPSHVHVRYSLIRDTRSNQTT